MIRRKCPTCGRGKNTPSRLPKLATARFCLDCSAKSKTLVELIAPKLEAARAKTAAKKKTAAKRERETEAAKTTVDGVDMRRAFARMLRLSCWRRWGIAEYMATIDFNMTRRSDGATSGRAWAGRKNVHVSAGVDAFGVQKTLLHELVHKAHFRRGHHKVAGRKRSAIHDAVFHDMLRVAACEFFKFDPAAVEAAYRKAGGARGAYTMDHALRAVRRAVDPEGAARADRLADDAARSAAEKKSGPVYHREGSSVTFDVSTSIFSALNLDEVFEGDGSIETISYKPRGKRGGTYRIRLDADGAETFIFRTGTLGDFPAATRRAAERISDTLRSFKRNPLAG